MCPRYSVGQGTTNSYETPRTQLHQDYALGGTDGLFLAIAELQLFATFEPALTVVLLLVARITT